MVARDRSLLAEFLVDALFKYLIVHRRYTAQTLNFRARYLLAAELYFFSLVLYSSDLIHSTLTKKINTVLRHKIRERESSYVSSENSQPHSGWVCEHWKQVAATVLY